MVFVSENASLRKVFEVLMPHLICFFYRLPSLVSSFQATLILKAALECLMSSKLLQVFDSTASAPGKFCLHSQLLRL